MAPCTDLPPGVTCSNAGVVRHGEACDFECETSYTKDCSSHIDGTGSCRDMKDVKQHVFAAALKRSAHKREDAYPLQLNRFQASKKGRGGRSDGRSGLAVTGSQIAQRSDLPVVCTTVSSPKAIP